MPWSVRKRGSKWCVVKDGESSPIPGGCHGTRAAAVKHQRALYANEPGASSQSVYNTGTDVNKLWWWLGPMEVTSGMGATVANMTEQFDVVEIFDTSGNVIGYTYPQGGTGTIPVTMTTSDNTSSFRVVGGIQEQEVEEQAWESVLAIVGHPTSDRRYLMPEEISNRELPLPFNVQVQTSEGHDGSLNAGRIEAIEFIPADKFEHAEDFGLRDLTDGAVVVYATGVFDSSDASQEAQRLIENGAGVSIDIPADRLALLDPETFEEVPEGEASLEDVLSGKFLTGIGGKIAGATIVTIPAFEEASVRLSEGQAVVASAARFRVTTRKKKKWAARARTYNEILTASGGLVKPPREWFDDPRLSGLTPLTITDEGRIYGHLADWDGCHTGFSNVCVPPFRSESNYAYFNVGEIETAEGDLVPVGKLMFSDQPAVGHAPTTPEYGAAEASKYYDDATKIAGFVRAGSDRHGTWLSGALRPGLSDEELQLIRANPPSGDWRPIPGKGSELVAAFCVPIPGFPIPRMLVASATDGLTIITGPLKIEIGPRERQRKMAMLRRRLAELRAA